MFRRFPCRWYRAIVFIAATVGLQLAGQATAVAQNLVPNPLLARDLPPPGWIGDHRDVWVKQHPVYASTCETTEVTKEVRYLNRAIAYDEYLLSLTNTPDTGNPASARLALVAKATMNSLRRDIVVADGLVAQLRLLSACDAGRPAPAPAANAVPANAMTAQAPQVAGVHPATAQPQPAIGDPASPPKESTTASPAPAAPAQTAAANVGEPAAPDRLVIRFDDKVAALTPSGIRAFNEAVAAARSGRKVQLAIEGCDAGADFSNGSPCARRLASLEHRLAENGVKDPRRLFGDLR